MKDEYLSKAKLISQLEFRQALSMLRVEEATPGSRAYDRCAAQLEERTALLNLVRHMPGEHVKKKHWLFDLIEGAD